MRAWARWSAVLACVLGAALAVPTPARAEVGTDEVVQALGLASEPADYVVLVDTSGSMNAGGRYAKVRTELGKLVAGLDADDRVSLFTFDTKAVPRFHGVVGKTPESVLAKLPKKATGRHTDIGAAIAAGIGELEKPDTHRLAALILITDGKLDAPGSTYANPKSSAWKALQDRASGLDATHQVAAYAVALQASTDAALLKQAFPQAAEVNASQVGARFAQVGGDLVRLQAAQELKEELAHPIAVSWTGDLGKALADGSPVDVRLTLTSGYAHVPVELTGVRVETPEGLTVTLTGLPEKVTLAPNQSVTLPVRAAVTGSAGWGSTAALAATVESPWQRALTEGLGLEFAPAFDGTASIPAAPIRLPPSLLSTIAAVVAVVVGAAVVLWLVRVLLIPPMNGLLTIRRGGRALADIPVQGRRAKVAAPSVAVELQGLTGSVRSRRAGKGDPGGVLVDLRFGAVRARGPIADGGTLVLGDMTVVYTSKHRRILDKIGFPDAAVPDSDEPAATTEDVPLMRD